MISTSTLCRVGGSTKIKADALALHVATSASGLTSDPALEKHNITLPWADFPFQLSGLHSLHVSVSMNKYVEREFVQGNP